MSEPVFSMKNLLPVILGAGLIAAPFTASAAIERTVEKNFTVQPGGTLRVETDGDGINVESAQGDMVKVVVKQRINASTDAEADNLLKNLTLTLEQKGNDVTAVAKYQGERVSRSEERRVGKECR